MTLPYKGQMSTKDHDLKNLVDLESLMLYTIIQSSSFLGSGEEDFKVFLPYMGMAAIL